MISLNTLSFSCDRTCPAAGEAWCRFRPILDGLGRTRINSHTTTVEVEYKDPRILEAAVRACGGLWYGMGDAYDLGDTEQKGWGFRLRMPEGKGFYRPPEAHGKGPCYWGHPLVLRSEDMKLAYDNWRGLGTSYGDASSLELLKGEYAVQHAKAKAKELGWLVEDTESGVRIYHPSKGVMTLNRGGEFDASNFVGNACHQAREQLGLQAVGAIIDKPELTHIVAQAREVVQ